MKHFFKKEFELWGDIGGRFHSLGAAKLYTRKPMPEQNDKRNWVEWAGKNKSLKNPSIQKPTKKQKI